jgi:hypothetical protein
MVLMVVGAGSGSWIQSCQEIRNQELNLATSEIALCQDREA